MSGHLDPMHRGHLMHMLEASKLGALFVIVGSDEQIERKYGYILSPLHKRIERVVRKAPFIRGVVVSVDRDDTQAETLRLIKPDIWAKGGDRVIGTLPDSEIKVCEELNIEIVYGVGEKLNSSTKIRERIERFRAK